MPQTPPFPLFYSNFLLVENGVGVTPGLWITWPTVKYNLPPDKLSGGSELALVSDGLIVGRAPQVDGSVRSEVHPVLLG